MPALPCSVSVVWSHCRIAHHSFQTRSSSTRCRHPEDRSPSERLHISYLETHRRERWWHTTRSCVPRFLSDSHPSFAATDLHEAREGPRLERHRRSPPGPPRLQPHAPLAKKEKKSFKKWHQSKQTSLWDGGRSGFCSVLSLFIFRSSLRLFSPRTTRSKTLSQLQATSSESFWQSTTDKRSQIFKLSEIDAALYYLHIYCIICI